MEHETRLNITFSTVDTFDIRSFRKRAGSRAKLNTVRFHHLDTDGLSIISHYVNNYDIQCRGLESCRVGHASNMFADGSSIVKSRNREKALNRVRDWSDVAANARCAILLSR